MRKTKQSLYTSIVLLTCACGAEPSGTSADATQEAPATASQSDPIAELELDGVTLSIYRVGCGKYVTRTRGPLQFEAKLRQLATAFDTLLRQLTLVGAYEVVSQRPSPQALRDFEAETCPPEQPRPRFSRALPAPPPTAAFGGRGYVSDNAIPECNQTWWYTEYCGFYPMDRQACLANQYEGFTQDYSADMHRTASWTYACPGGSGNTTTWIIIPDNGVNHPFPLPDGELQRIEYHNSHGVFGYALEDFTTNRVTGDWGSFINFSDWFVDDDRFLGKN